MSHEAVQRLFDRLAAPSGGKGKKGPVACVMLAGADAYLRDTARAGILKAVFPEGAPEWAVVRVSLREEGLDSVLRMAQSYPMLAARQVIFAQDWEALEESGDDAREDAHKGLSAYLDDPAPFTLLVLEAASLDQRTRLSKLLDEHAFIVSLDLSGKPQDQIHDAVSIITEMARSSGAGIEPEAAAQLSDCLDGELARIAPEVAKLSTYAGPGRRITAADVALLVQAAKRFTVWQLAEMLAAGQRDKALAFLDGLLRDGEEPAGLVGAMAWMYRKLIEVQELPPGTNKFAAAGKLRMRPDTVELAQKQARIVPRERLLHGIIALAAADSRLKSGNRAPRAVLEFLITELTAA
jgi:DNA polymerase III subunit delta